MNLAINLTTLSAPIRTEQPTGIPLRDDPSPQSLYYQIKDARLAARNAERLVIENDHQQHERPNWQIVYELAVDILSSHSKDLEICAWFNEALLRQYGFAGLATGFELCSQLIEQYWPSLHPLPDEEGLNNKVAALAGLNGIDTVGTLIQPIGAVPICQGQSKGPYTLWQYQQALDLENITHPARRERRIQQGAITLADFNIAISETEPHFFTSLNNQIDRAQQHFTTLTQLLDAKCDGMAPPSSNIKNALIQYQDTLKIIMSDMPQVEQENITTNHTLSKNIDHTTTNNTIDNRDNALKTLITVATYFQKNEPHSPLPYILKRAVRWGNLPFNELLTELITNESSRSEVFSLTGIE